MFFDTQLLLLSLLSLSLLLLSSLLLSSSSSLYRHCAVYRTGERI